MVMEMISNTSFDPVTEILSLTIEAIVEVVIAAKDVLIKKESFAELASYLNRLVPILKELTVRNASKSEDLNHFVDNLYGQVKVAKQLMSECSKKSKVYLLMNCRSITNRLEAITREISGSLSLIPFGSLDVSLSIIKEVDRLCESMRSAEFKTAVAEEEILEKIDTGIQERKVDRSYANQLLVSIAEAVGISTERSALKKAFDEFKSEIENAQLRKDQAEAIQMDQIISLLERADATSSPEEKERKYLSKRDSLGSQTLNPLESFVCPITREVMVDPVEISTGHTFERSAIEKWFADGNVLCPLTMTTLETLILRPNKTLKQSIEEWKDRNTIINIGTMRQKLLSGDEEDVLHCLDELQHLCEQRDLHQEWIVLENYIPLLIELLRTKNRDAKNRALVILLILAKDSDDAKGRIAKADNAIESIVRCLGRDIGQGKLAVMLLLELSKRETVRDYIGNVQGCILLLVTMSRSNDDEQAAKYARELLENLSFCDHNVVHMAKSSYFKHLLQRLSSGPEDVKMMMTKTLAEMELTDHNKSVLFQEGVLESLLYLVLHGHSNMKETAAKALHNLSSLPKNGRQMIRQGSVSPLLNLLYHHTSSQSLRELLAAIIMQLAVSSMSQGSGEAQVSLLETDEEINSLFSYINCTEPVVQQSILRAFYAMCQSPLAPKVKEKLKLGSEVLNMLQQLCEADSPEVRANAVKLLSCLTEDGSESVILKCRNQKLVETLIRIIKSSNEEEEIASAMGIISNLPESTHLTKWLLEAGGLSGIYTHLPYSRFNGPHKQRLVENAVGALFHFTIPTNQQAQKKAAEIGLIPVLVNLLEFGTSLTKTRASISLSQFSRSSPNLSQPIPRPLGLLRCFSPPPESGCPVHQGICSVESSFCLVKADAISPLVRVLEESNINACKASLDALLTLIEGERLKGGSKFLSQAKAISPMIKLLGCSSPDLQEKVLRALERIFRLVEFRQFYGPIAHMPLVDLTQRGNNVTKSLAAKILAQLNELQELSSYF